MIGGQGERKTLRLMAQHAEMANFTSGFDELPRKLDVLAAHCADVGRDPAAINKTPLGSLVLAATMEEAEAKRNRFLADRGLDWDALDESTRALVGARLIVGDPDAVGEQVRDLLATGLDGIIVNMPADGWDLEAVAHAGQVLSAALG
jgi:alkanesulfonate monooxygenase SsuD/methylene tetrahydromethanopterin reductase-like flavin-dependent oxidoreductase (luciferase family)